jgi:ribonuclease-3
MGRVNETLQRRLGHEFADAGLLRRALTHPSADGVNYQRFEFLGDRVLGLVIAGWLLEAYPDADEGELAVRFNALVRKEACAEVAVRAGLGGHVVMGGGEEKAGGRQKAAILADACEAVIAALYLDGGLSAAERFIKAEWTPLLDKSVSVPQDAKTALQEWAQGAGKPVPKYLLDGRTGPDHAPEFTVSVQVEGQPGMQAKGASKRQAEQAAARAMLENLGLWRRET